MITKPDSLSFFFHNFHVNQYAYRCIKGERKAILHLHTKHFSPDTLFWTASTVTNHVPNKIKQKENNINEFPQIRYRGKKKRKNMHKILILANIVSIKDVLQVLLLKMHKSNIIREYVLLSMMWFFAIHHSCLEQSLLAEAAPYVAKQFIMCC